MKKRNLRIGLLVSILIFLFTGLFADNKFTISGTVYDNESGEFLPSASVTVKELPGYGLTCNQYGYYALSLPEGTYTLQVSYLGFQQEIFSVILKKNIFHDFRLKTSSRLLNEVTISAIKKNDNIISDKAGVEKLQIREISKIPVFFGEQDILKTLTLTPGVKTVGEGNGGIYVRGGNNSQNLVLLDEATVFNANHLLGFFSTFNSDAIRDVMLYKGTAPAEFGGRLSSVIDVHMNEGNNQHFGVNGGIGLIASRLTIDGPLVKDKGSFLISGRRTYADLFLKLSPDENIRNNELHFYDLNAKFNFKISDRDKIFISGYMGRDMFEMIDRFGVDWGNQTATLRWNHLWSQKVFSNTSLIYSNFDYAVNVKFDESTFKIYSKIRNFNLKQDFQYFINGKNNLLFGFQGFRYAITPGQVEADSGSIINPVRIADKFGYESALYVSHNYKPDDKWNLTFGVRLNMFNLVGPGDFYVFKDGEISDSLHVDKPEILKTFFLVEPRLNITHIINQSQSLKFSYTRNSQQLHLISNSTGTMPTDIWLMSGLNIKPQISDLISTGYFRNFNDDLYQLSAEVYYKWMLNQPDLKNGADIRANEKIEGELLYGNGRAYGLELMLKKKSGKLNGWLSYTLSRTELKIPGINDGQWYPARQDITHDLSLVGIYDLSKRLSVSGTWVYQTGNAITFPSGKYKINEKVVYYYTERNGYRMPPYHRLDLGVTWYFKSRKNFESNLNVSVYNVYARKNAYSIDFEQDPDNPEITRTVMTYLFTVIPSITYNFKF